MSNNISQEGNIFLRMKPIHRIILSIVFAGFTYFFLRQSNLSLLVELIIVWDVFAFFYLIACWIVLFTRPKEQMRQIARREDVSRTFFFIFIIVSSFASMFAVMLLIISRKASDTALAIYLPVAITGMLLSWIMVHTMFTFHYAHLYYGDDKSEPGKHAEGLEFPQEKKPDYLDFAYFSFVIGMTFQVSDVQITSHRLRRIALLHGLLAFSLNTFVVALTINLIAGLRG